MLEHYKLIFKKLLTDQQTKVLAALAKSGSVKVSLKGNHA